MLSAFNRESVKILAKCALCQAPAQATLSSFNHDHLLPGLEAALCAEHGGDPPRAFEEIRRILRHANEVE